MTVWYSVFKTTIFRPLTKWWFKVKLEGHENIPSGGCILAANHLDAGDTIALPAMIDPQMVFPAKKELFMGKGFKGRIVAWFLTLVGQAPIDRSGGKASVGGLGSVETWLAHGEVVGIFPEGTRSPDGRLYQGHTGVARLTLGQHKPVLPVALINTRLVKNALGLPTMKGARIIIGKPVSYDEWAGQNVNHKVLRWVTNDIMARIQQLTGQEYIGVYASRVKRGDLHGADLSEYILPSPNHGVEPPPTTTELADEAQS